MDAKALLIELTRRGVTLRRSGGLIECTAPQKPLCPDIKAELTGREHEILSLYSGSPISDSLQRIAEFWDSEVESRGAGDAAWSWIKASFHWALIKAAEREVDLIGRNGNPDALNAACSNWIAAWIQAIKTFRNSKSQMGFDY